MDQGGEWEAEFILILEQHAIGTKVTGAHGGWQLRHAERHGAHLGIAWSALIFEHQIEDVETGPIIVKRDIGKCLFFCVGHLITSSKKRRLLLAIIL